MITVQAIMDGIEEWAPRMSQEPWDNCGLSVGQPQTPVTGVLLCLDCTEAVVKEAISLGYNMVVSHHPLIFKGLLHLCESTVAERTVALALRNHVAVYSAHTNADKAWNGVSWAMANALHLKEVDVLDAGGLGLVGNLPAPMSPHAFRMLLKDTFHLQGMKASAGYNTPIQRVALCGGSGSSLIAQALETGAQAYVSGDFSYHHYFDVIPRMMLVDIGHYESEVGVLVSFSEVLTKKFPTFAVRITQENTNPIEFY